MNEPRTTCDASIPGIGAQPLGPCILRHEHDGPVHQDASGAKWWHTSDSPRPEMPPMIRFLADDEDPDDAPTVITAAQFTVADCTPLWPLSVALLDDADTRIDLGQHLRGYQELLDQNTKEQK